MLPYQTKRQWLECALGKVGWLVAFFKKHVVSSELQGQNLEFCMITL